MGDEGPARELWDLKDDDGKTVLGTLRSDQYRELVQPLSCGAVLGCRACGLCEGHEAFGATKEVPA